MSQNQAVNTRKEIPNFAIQKVLVVDDSRAQRRLVSMSLLKWGLQVLEAGSGKDALRICEEEVPDLVISDWMMPGMNGLEFCRSFREIPRANYGYFILFTSKSDKEDVAQGLDAGADDFLTKPVNAAELRARISAGDRIVEMQRQLSEKNRLIQSTLSELQDLYDSLDSDLLEAKQLQQSLVKQRYQDFGRAEASLLLRSSGHVGGDLVGIFNVNEDQIGLYAIDVSGHGISSALMTARLAGFLSASTPEQNLALERRSDGTCFARSPADTVTELNRMFLEEIESEHYFTLLLALVDLSSGKVTMSQAGHPNPVVQRANGCSEKLGDGGLPVGLIDGAVFDQFETRLYPGDRLLIHSDGVDECASEDGTLFGQSGVEKVLSDFHESHGPEFFESLVWSLAQFSKKDDFEDDVSAILLEFIGSK